MPTRRDMIEPARKSQVLCVSAVIRQNWRRRGMHVRPGACNMLRAGCKEVREIDEAFAGRWRSVCLGGDVRLS
ncbi:hypothetical protein CC86DRAFT_369823 [Ophiobolus disseminans]|uniref:Uncharacterized protein n=1 Tax=Ophiobolus disseminans TaxID=1469910 RepID=A0A6A7A016_9PLEO|nr:hypothetical protein CC86DRAFT_369823 [Ophiobolus disseminans]